MLSYHCTIGLTRRLCYDNRENINATTKQSKNLLYAFFLFSIDISVILFFACFIRILCASQFWGSSILSSQQDAVKSAKELNDGNVFSADVTGISLSTMVRSTMLALKENASPEEESGGILIVKIDVEGAEYQVLKEVAASGILCKLKELGNRVVLVVEYHNMSITNATERRREKDGHQEAIKKMEQCGVEFQKLSANWA